MRRSAWTWAEIEQFRRWHAMRLEELAYPERVVVELTAAREQWLSAIPVKGCREMRL